MNGNKYIAFFSDYDINELENELANRKMSLCQATVIEEMDELMEAIEALEFLIQNCELDG